MKSVLINPGIVLKVTGRISGKKICVTAIEAATT